MNKTITFLKFALMFSAICAIILGLLEHESSSKHIFMFSMKDVKKIE